MAPPSCSSTPLNHLSAEEALALRDYVFRGGARYASGGTSLVDTQGMRAPDFRLADVFGVSLRKADWSDREHDLTPTEDGAADFAGWDRAHPPFVKGYGFEVEARPGARVLATTTWRWPAPDPTRFSSIHSNPSWVATNRPEVVLHEYGRGKAVCCASLLEEVDGLGDTLVRFIHRLLPAPTFEADAPGTVEVILFHQPERRRHLPGLVHFQGELPNIPVPDLRIRVRLDPRIRRVERLPDGRALAIRRRGPVTEIVVPRLETLAMIALRHG